MNTQLDRQTAGSPMAHELRFESLHRPGRGIAVPCGEDGSVDMDRLSERMKMVYLGARAMVGREYAYPVVQRIH